MSGKNDRMILAGMMAIAVIAVACAATVFGIGAFIFMSEPAASPTPGATATVTPTPAPAPTEAPPLADGEFLIERIVEDRGGRTYTVIMGLAPGTAPVDMSMVTAQLLAGGHTYPAWDYLHSEHRWSANADVDALLEAGEAFTIVIYAPQAGLPFGVSPPVRLDLLVDALPVYSTNVSAV